MANKHYVISLRPNVFVKDVGSVQTGTIVSTHTESHTARDAAETRNKQSHASHKAPDFGYLESDVALAKGSCHPDLAQKWLDNKFEQDAIHAMKCIIDPGWIGGRVVSDERIGWMIEDLGIGLKELTERYEGKAREELDKRHINRIELAEQQARVRAVGDTLNAERSQFTYTFPAVAGLQSGRAYYAAQVPYSALVKLFTFDEEDVVPAHLRAQRLLNEKRAEAIGSYVVDNLEDYVLPAITASVSAEMSFEPVPVPGAAGRIGLLHIPMEATMLINDGQHRRRGIELAMAQKPYLRDETITVTIYFDQGLERSQQMFADINGKQVKPSSAINALYDRRNPYNAWVLSILDLIPSIGSRIDVENSSVAAKSYKLWSLISFKKFLSLLTGVTEKNVTDIQVDTLKKIDAFLVEFFDQCGETIPKWDAMIAGSISAYEVRENFVIGHAVWLEALGVFARRAIFPSAIDDAVIQPDHAQWAKLSALEKVDPRKESLMWAGRCVVLGKMQKTSDGVKGTASKLLFLANVPLGDDMRALEKRLAA